MIALIIIVLVFATLIYLYLYSKKRTSGYQMPANTAQLLLDHVPFYVSLAPDKRRQFETRIKDFLDHTVIRGVDTDVDDLDHILIAAGAIMLIFAFPDWRYNNLNEVLVYNTSFDRDFNTAGPERDVLGMVGDGAMHRVMILSKPSLRASFNNTHDGHNTVIHEFAHLLDKADGATDGIPEYLLDKLYILPWIKNMHDTMRAMKEQHSPDINIYGATNEAEFFAVVTEYFFEKPEELKQRHPELFKLLQQMFLPTGDK